MLPDDEEWLPQEEYQSQEVSGDLKKFLPVQKIEKAMRMQAKVKMRPKPQDTEETKRSVSAHSVDERKRKRADWDGVEPDGDKELPWDMRGPPGPQEGGPEFWRGQKCRPNTDR